MQNEHAAFWVYVRSLSRKPLESMWSSTHQALLFLHNARFYGGSTVCIHSVAGGLWVCLQSGEHEWSCYEHLTTVLNWVLAWTRIFISSLVHFIHPSEGNDWVVWLCIGLTVSHRPPLSTDFTIGFAWHQHHVLRCWLALSSLGERSGQIFIAVIIKVVCVCVLGHAWWHTFSLLSSKCPPNVVVNTYGALRL